MDHLLKSFPPGRRERSAPFFLILLLVLALSAHIRLNHLSIPFERDEGEYGYAAHLILQGTYPFQETYNMKMPGIYFAYAGVMGIFGDSVEGVHLGLLFVTLLTSFLLYFTLRRLYSPLVGCTAAGVYAILPLIPRLQGMAGNAEHFVLLFAVPGLLFLILAVDQKNRGLLFPSGLLLGTAFVVKQHGLAFLLFGLFYLALAGGRGRLRNLLWLGLSSILPFLVTVLLMIRAGVFDRFWFWTFTYAGRYVTMTSLIDGMVWLRSFMGHLVASSPVPWVLGAIGLLSLGSDRMTRLQKGFAIGFFLFSFAAVSPGFYFRPHYFILLLPSIGLLAGIGLESLKRGIERLLDRPRSKAGWAIGLILLLAATGHSVYLQRNPFFSMSSAQLIRAAYGMNPFLEAPEVARVIQARSGADDRIAVIGSEPEIYYYAGRRAATGYLYTYPLTESHPFAERMQKEMISEIEHHLPRFVVFVGNPFSWTINPGGPTPIFDWFNDFVVKRYDLIGTAETLSFDETRYVWDEAATSYQKRSRFWMDVFERKGIR